jgi:hypothetical protein
MDLTSTRYRGAQPFADDALSHRTFFGRQEAALSLTNQILANRLVVVYAKSGVGKSSLLNAGVAPRLREARCQPLLVRVNDTRRGPLESVYEGVRAEALRQQVEYVHGDTASLWSFFKTVEFWRDDLLLTPVLVIDQFEELFTMHGQAARDVFLTELSHLVRGVRPASNERGDPARLSDAPPNLHIVLSLREDFLGILEDAADRIPQILDHRFRLVPLSRENAAQAMVGPATLSDATFSTRTFSLDPAFVDAVLDHLTMQVPGGSEPTRRQVEPFHLQLICRRIEQIVAARHGQGADAPAFGMTDFGGEAALAQTLRNFYTDAIASVSEARLRPAARRLCEEFLISPEGRRLSLEEIEIRKQLRLSEAALGQLVGSRLLRTDRRSDSTYYELGHDALVEPVLATRRVQALLLSWGAIVFGSVVLAVGGLLVLVLVLMLALPSAFESEALDLFEALVSLLILCGLLLIPLRVFRSGIRTHRRFRRRKRQEAPAPIPGYVPLPDRLLGWSLVAAGSVLTAAMAAIVVMTLIIVLALLLGGGQLPPWLQWVDGPEAAQIYQRPLPEIAWLVVELSTLLAFGVVLWRSGRRRLHLQTPSAPLAGESVRLAASLLGCAVAVLGFVVLQRCAGTSQGQLPAWLAPGLLSVDIPDACARLYSGQWSVEEVFLLLFLVAVLYLSLPALGRALRRLRR